MKRLILSFMMIGLLLIPNSMASSVYASYYEPIEKREVVARDERQLECLSDNIYYESKGEPNLGKVAVAFVTINRTKDQSFPEDICQVVKQKEERKCQFSWYCDRKLKRESQQKMTNKMEDINYLKSRLVAEMVFAGHSTLKDPTNGALYFHAKYVKVHVKGKKIRAKIGKHIFYDIKKRV